MELPQFARGRLVWNALFSEPVLERRLVRTSHTVLLV